MPEPSRLVLLQQLQTVEPGSKVRFLGCVHEYKYTEAQLVLRNHYPASEPTAPCVLVDIENILENTSHELLETGAWLNVLGYMKRDIQPDGPNSRHKPNGVHSKTAPAVLVTAMMIWSAGAIRMDRYESSVREYQQQQLAPD